MIHSIKELHLFVEGMTYPVAVFIRTDRDKLQIRWLEKNISELNLDVENLCQWCISHRIQYRLFYPRLRMGLIKTINQFMCFKRLQKRLEQYQDNRY